MDELETQPAFVLLDEILRGTNSDDKRNGTIEVVKKIISKKAIGAIATHDIEVCLTTSDYPNILTNKCFEVEIINDDLHFDYKLRDGICKNRSASFLMKKMGVIQREDVSGMRYELEVRFMNVQWGNSKDEIRGARYEIRSTSYKVLQFNTICVYILSKKKMAR